MTTLRSQQGELHDDENDYSNDDDDLTFETLCEIFVAIVLALKTRLMWPKVTFLFLNVPRREGGGMGGAHRFRIYP